MIIPTCFRCLRHLSEWEAKIAPVIYGNTYCIDCHEQNRKKGRRRARALRRMGCA